ncbi:MAG TPA: phospholipid carrier-dependent glycosyltransferase [Streptosporangiaceae bacterium]|nr:phospholipid carrier-dependent glycosyltransferase [Streptosporangiaceae bacterium]
MAATEAGAEAGASAPETPDEAETRPAGRSTDRSRALRDRLVPALPSDRLWGWIGTLLVTAFGGYLRFDRLRVPRTLIFDETYYAKDAWSYLQYGVEIQTFAAKKANAIIQAGGTHFFMPKTPPEYVVQPPLGKWLIAGGEWLYGLNSLGWRFSAAVFGTLSILLICRIARRLTRSTLLGCIAGLLMSLDGLEFVMSRTGLLDIFLMFFILAAFGCLVIDRDVSRARLAAAVTANGTSGLGPGTGIHWWRVAAGFFLGCACASKQFGAWYIVGFAGLAIAWDVGARRAVGIGRFWVSALVKEARWLPVSFGLVPLAVYIASWSGWFASSLGWDRHYAATHGVRTPVLSGLYSLYEYHIQMLQFGVGLKTHHPYESQPWDWLVISRPVAYAYQCYTSPTSHRVCPSNYTGPRWSQEVLAIGTPAIWWAAIPALVFCVFWWLLHRDWRAGAVVLAMLTGWVTWFPFVSRTKFYYYALEFEPFMILAIVLCIGLIIGATRGSVARRSIGAAVTGAYLLVVLLNFVYLYPILAGKVIPYTAWLSRMWYHGWI